MPSIRERTFEILDIGAKNDRLSRIIDVFLITLISLNVLSVILETLPALQVRYQSLFDSFEIVSVIIFSIEYFARVWCSVEAKEKDYSRPFLGPNTLYVDAHGADRPDRHTALLFRFLPQCRPALHARTQIATSFQVDSLFLIHVTDVAGAG